MTEEPVKSPHYVLVVDKKGDDILGILLQTVSHTPGAFAYFDRICRASGITDEDVISFVSYMSDKNHEMGWCEDENCIYEKKS